jgi:hypothetical protein
MIVDACPTYRYTYLRHGRVIYDSLNPDTGTPVRGWVATLDSTTFDVLAKQFLQKGFFRLQRRYSAGATDQREIIVRAGLLELVKTVSEDEGAGPPELHELEQLLDSAGHRLTWHSVSDSS